MRPYYEENGIAIYQGDCRDVMPTLPRVDLVLTDPPYGIQDRAFQTVAPRVGKRTATSNTWHPDSDWDAFIDVAWCELACLAAPTVAWFGHWRKRESVEAGMAYPLRAEIIWAKDCHVGPPCPLAMRDERIWVFSAQSVQGRTFETSVWNEPMIPTWEYKHHKNQKPEGLIKRLLRWLPDGVVLDPFMGSGTTLRAAKDLGRKAIGIEIEERYCEIAANRLRQEVLAFA